MKVLDYIKQIYKSFIQHSQNFRISVDGLEEMLRKEVSIQGQSTSAKTIEFGRLHLIFGFSKDLPYSPAYVLPNGTVTLVMGREKKSENPLYKIFIPRDFSVGGLYIWNSKIIPLAQDVQEAYFK